MKAVTKSCAALSRETSAFAIVISSPIEASAARSATLLQSALLTAMKRLADRPLPATSPTRKNRRSASMKK